MTDLTGLISRISEINRAIGSPELTRPVENLLGNANKTINIAVLGQFKSGKSSLINSLVGENILPVGVVPVTAIVTSLQYGMVPQAKLQFTDGRLINIEIDKLQEFVTEKHNPGNIRKVAMAIVEHPALEGYKKVNIIDTPGLGSFYRHNSETTLQWLPYTGIALVSISAERPLSEDDIKLLKGISGYCPNIAVVITKTDLFKPNELEEIKSHISQSVVKTLQYAVPVIEYSIYHNQQNYREHLTRLIIEPINENFEKKYNDIIRYKIRGIIEQSLHYARLSLQTALKREHEKEAVIKLLQEIKTNRHHHEREMLLSASSFKGEIRDKLEKIIIPYKSQITEKILHAFASDYFQWQGSLFQFSRKYEQWLKDQLGNEISELENECFERINSIVKESLDYFEYSALQFRSRLEEKIISLLGVQLPFVSWQIDFNGIEKPDISIYRAFDSHIDTLLFFLPMRGFKRLFYTHFEKQIPKEAEKNLYRYISGLTVKIIRAIDAIHHQALGFIIHESRNIEKILLNEKNSCTELQESIDRLREINP